MSMWKKLSQCLPMQNKMPTWPQTIGPSYVGATLMVARGLGDT